MVYSVQNNVAYINGKTGIYDAKVQDSSVRYGRNAVSNYMEYCKNLGDKGNSIDALDLKSALDEFKITTDENKKRYEAASSRVEKNQIFNETIALTDRVESDATDFLTGLEQDLKSKPINFEYRYLPETNGTRINRMALMGAAFEEIGRKISIPVQQLTDLLKKGSEAIGSKTELSAQALDINKDGQIDISEYAASILVADMLSTNPDRLDISDVDGVINNNGLNQSSAYANVKNASVAAEAYSAIHSAMNLSEAQKEFTSNSNNMIDIQA